MAFNARREAVVVQRMKRDKPHTDEVEHSRWYGLKLAVSDYRTWIFVSLMYNVPQNCAP